MLVNGIAKIVKFIKLRNLKVGYNDAFVSMIIGFT